MGEHRSGSVCRCDRIHDQKQLGEDRVCLTYSSGSSIKEARQELKQRLWRKAAYCLAPPTLLPRVGTAHSGLVPRTSIINQDNAHR